MTDNLDPQPDDGGDDPDIEANVAADEDEGDSDERENGELEEGLTL